MPVPVYPSDEPEEEEVPDGELPTFPLRTALLGRPSGRSSGRFVVVPGH